MKSSRFAFVSLRSPAAIVLALGFGLSAVADAPKSLLPPFGNAGSEFKKTSKDDHAISGWLPKNWVDNSKWAAVNATYTKLDDSPDKDAGAVRIKIEKVDDGQLQLTTFEGNTDYKKGSKYVVSGWIRSPLFSTVKVGVREFDEPRAFYDQVDLTTGAEWKRFEYTFTPDKDCSGLVMFVAKEPGTIDLAGIAIEEKP